MQVVDEEVVRAQSRLGVVLRGKYRLERVLGIGAMATVYAAIHRNTKRFAVKVLHPHLSGHGEIRTRFQREGYLANQVQHPGAVTVIDDDVADDGSAFLVMELLEGVTVEDLWEGRGRRLPTAIALGIGYQLLDVLAAAHARRIVHRDIKPANLFLTVDGQLKVLDFGIARIRDATSSLATNAGIVMGTPAFMSPEQALATPAEVDAQSDIWAVGAVLYTLLSGRIVHDADNAQRILIKAATQPADSLAVAVPGAPREVVELVDRALAFDKAQRWPMAATMQIALGATSGLILDEPPTPAVLATFLAGAEPDSEWPRPASPALDRPGAQSSGTREELMPSDVAIETADQSGSSVAQRTEEKQKAVAAHGPRVATTRSRALLALAAGGLVGLATVAMSSVWPLHADVVPASIALPAVRPQVRADPPPTTLASPSPVPKPNEPPLISVDQLPVARPIEAPPRRAAPLGTRTGNVGRLQDADSPQTAAKPGCDPPFEYDELGDKEVKPGCE